MVDFDGNLDDLRKALRDKETTWGPSYRLEEKRQNPKPVRVGGAVTKYGGSDALSFYRAATDGRKQIVGEWDFRKNKGVIDSD
ncbi:MAG: hypothetical protein HY706_13720 [Candidatus Hydrogenedentes bacterium]|nr:hypothetical protein [Candidatus Hydrogenedentota bacterium]